MTEAETMATLATIGDTIAAYIGLWVTTTFAYLTVAYLVGTQLTRFQTAAVTGLYLVSSSLFALSAIANSEAWITLSAKHSTTYGSISLSRVYGIWLPGMWVIVIAGMIVSLYFMHDVRARARIDLEREG